MRFFTLALLAIENAHASVSLDLPWCFLGPKVFFVRFLGSFVPISFFPPGGSAVLPLFLTFGRTEIFRGTPVSV